MILENNDCRLKINHKPGGRATHTYIVELLSGIFPSDNDLITICDEGKFDGVSCHFGGNVTGSDTIKKVEVYVD